jgi:hypothetical protein
MMASSVVFAVSFAKVAKRRSSSPNKSMISWSVPYPMARMKTVMGTFLIRSIRTDMTSLESVSYSNQAPRLGMTVQEYSIFPVLSILPA